MIKLSAKDNEFVFRWIFYVDGLHVHGTEVTISVSLFNSFFLLIIHTNNPITLFKILSRGIYFVKIMIRTNNVFLRVEMFWNNKICSYIHNIPPTDNRLKM